MRPSTRRRLLQSQGILDRNGELTDRGEMMAEDEHDGDGPEDYDFRDMGPDLRDDLHQVKDG